MPTPTPPPPHPDDQLPAPLRWATRLFGSWRFVALLALLLAGYLAAAFVPVGGRYLYQSRWIDTPQPALLGWWPLHAVMLLLACALVWAVLRRVSWRWRNAGWFLAAAGFGFALVGLSTSWRFQTHGLLAVQPHAGDALPLQTRYLDPSQRVLFVQVGRSEPQQVPLDGLPWWHDRGPDTLQLPLHQHAGLRSQLNYRAQVHVVGYVADGTLLTETRSTNGAQSQAVMPAALSERRWPLNDGPTRSFLAVRFTSNTPEGPAEQTVVWLPMDLAAGQRVVPPRAYHIAGLGEVRLAFTLANKDLGFAVAAEPHGHDALELQIVDIDPATRQVIPPLTEGLYSGQSARYRPVEPEPAMSEVVLTAGPAGNGDNPIPWVVVRSTPALTVAYIGAAITAFGLLLALAARLFTATRTQADAAG